MNWLSSRTWLMELLMLLFEDLVMNVDVHLSQLDGLEILDKKSMSGSTGLMSWHYSSRMG